MPDGAVDRPTWVWQVLFWMCVVAGIGGLAIGIATFFFDTAASGVVLLAGGAFMLLLAWPMGSYLRANKDSGA